MQLEVKVHKIIFTLVGIALIAIGQNFLVFSNVGAGPLEVFTQVIGQLLQISYANATFVFQAFILCLVLLLRKRLKFSSLEIILSFIVLIILRQVISDVSTVLIYFKHINKYILFSFGFITYTLGIAFYIKDSMVVTPFDKLIVGIKRKSKHQVGTIKIATDILLTVIACIAIFGLNVEVTIGISTFFIMFAAGEFINIYHKLFINRLFAYSWEKKQVQIIEENE